MAVVEHITKRVTSRRINNEGLAAMTKHAEHEKPEAPPESGGPVHPLVMRGPEHMKEAVSYLQEYMNAYTNQPGYENFTAQTLVDDVLYGLGVALDQEEHEFAQGYRAFKVRLKAHLDA